MICNIPYIKRAPISETEKNRLEGIHLSIEGEVKSSKAFRLVNNQYRAVKGKYSDATKFVGEVVTKYKPGVAKLVSIGNGNAVLNINVLPLANEKQEELFQLEDSVASKASPKTIKLIKDLLDKIGVSYEATKDITVNGVKLGANGVANIVQGLINVVEGKEAEALPEEAMHFVVELIQQTNPKLFNQLLKEINQYDILKTVFETYGKNPYYQLDGKPDILKLKKEAIAKVLAETVIKKNEGQTEKPELLAKTQSWWNQILDFIRNLFIQSGFDKAAMDVISGKVEGTVEDLRESQEDVFLQQTTQDSIYERIKTIKSTVEVREDGYYVNGVKVPKRVTDFAKTWYDRRFAEKALGDSEFDKAVKDLKAEKGTAGHKDLEHAFSLFVDENGYLRKPENYIKDDDYVSLLSPKNRKMYEILRDNLQDRLESFPEGTRFMSEVVLYDKTRGVAGTVDFLAIDKQGQVSVLDWKFMDLNIQKYTDVPWYKINAWRIQMEQYKLLLERVYGVKAENFGQTRMIPIKTVYASGDPKTGKLPRLKSIKIGAIDPKDITDDYLLPVPTQTEKTGSKAIDKLIEKLNAIYTKFSEKKATPEEKASKAEQLNNLFSAIRQLQVKQNIEPLVKQAKILTKQIKKTINQFNNNWSGKPVTDFTQDDISRFYDDLQSAEHAIEQYTSLDIELDFLFENKTLTEEDKKLRDELEEVVKDARRLYSALSSVTSSFVNDFVAESEGVSDILKPEKIIKGLSKWFSSTATLQIKALQVLYKKANRALGFAQMDTVEESKKLESLKEEYEKWASSKGLSKSQYFDIIKKKDKNELIDEFDPSFYKLLKQKVNEGDISWIKENINVEEYKEHLKELLLKETKRVVENADTHDENERQTQAKLERLKKEFNTSTNDSIGWLKYSELMKFPVRDKWESKAWRELTKSENKPAKDFYDYIKQRNEFYKEIGYIHAKQARVFLPFIRKGVMETLITGGKLSIGEQFLRNISIDEGDVGYGKTDPLTGRLIDTVPVYLTREIEGDLSTDLFRNMALYNEMAIRYKYIIEIEPQARALIETERNKKAIATSMFGKTVYKDGALELTHDNNENTKLVEDMVKGIIYGQKYIQSETFDQVLGTFGTFGEKFNKKLGFKLFPENLEGRQLSINKSINQLNTIFQLKALGLNPLSALSNLMGGSFQSIINAGTYFTKTEFMASEFELSLGKLFSKDKEKMIAALEYFLPLTENYNKEIAKKLTVNKLSQENIQEFLMVLMRKSDFFVQTANFYSFLKNTIVVDGEVVNAREYVRNLPEYKDNMYLGLRAERDARKERFEKDVQKLIEEKGVIKLATVKNGKLEIPGVERKSQSVIDLRRKVQQLSKDALGNLSDDDMRTINMNIYGKSFMLFKNWIPRLVDTRFGNLKYNSALDAYEWGRSRMIFRIISDDVLGSLANLSKALMGTNKGVDYMRQLWEKKKEDYEKETGKQLEMTEDQFIELVRKNIRSQLVDSLFMLGLFGLFIGLKAAAPDDDEDPRVINAHKFLLRATDKIKDELRFFYDPTSFTSLVSSGIFPSMSYIDNYKKLVVNFGKEMYGLGVGDKEMVEDTKVIKYVMKSFPITSQGASYLPMFYPDLAKELGIRMTTESRPVTLR